MSRIPIYRLRQFVTPGGCYHAARTFYARGTTCPQHGHDFAEVFWVEQGRVDHQVNGHLQTLDTGGAVLIRPGDVHGLKAAAAGGFTITNVAFPAETWRFIQQRYFRSRAAWAQSQGRRPPTWTLAPGDLAMLASRVEHLSMASQGRLDLESFLLAMFQCLRDRQQNPSRSKTSCPWLSQAIARYRQQADLSGSPAHLASIAGCSVAHLNRIVRQEHGITTTELLNQLRLAKAAHLLRMTHQPITTLAMDCGFENLGYFYRCFTKQFHATPRRYRLAAQFPPQGLQPAHGKR